MQFKVGDEVFLRVKFCGESHQGMEDWSVVESCDSDYSYGMVRNKDLIPSPITIIEKEIKSLTRQFEGVDEYKEGLMFALNLLKGESK